ncbi:MAG: hypothetical protein HY902_10070 [Deltaproteobacteria bacterium]|nr:hypothetical protein [Deltaproteobacteria bacterium]
MASADSAAAAPLARAATDLAAAASPAVAPGHPATETQWQPGAEGSLLGLADADFFVDRAAAHLRQQAPALAEPGPLLLVRQVAGAAAQDTLTASLDRVSLETAGVDWHMQRAADGCVATVGPLKPGAPSGPCPEIGDDALALAAALLATAQPGLRPALQVEGLQSSGDLQLRLAVPAWRLRWQVTIAPSGELRSIEIPSQGLTLRPYRDEAGWWAAASSTSTNTAWQWRLGRTDARARTWLARVPPPGLALDDDRARRLLSEPIEVAVKQGRATLLGPLTAELRRSDGKWRIVAGSAQVLTSARELLENSEGATIDKPGPLLWIKPVGPAGGGAAAAQLLATETATCLLAGAVESHAPQAAEQLFVRACAERPAAGATPKQPK